MASFQPIRKQIASASGISTADILSARKGWYPYRFLVVLRFYHLKSENILLGGEDTSH